MASLNKLHPLEPKKPGQWLGFFAWGVSVVAALVIVTDAAQALLGEDQRFFGFDGTKWLAFFAGWATIVGAVATAKISINNAVKQHTINILLQMRMSDTYMQRAMIVQDRYYGQGGIYTVSYSECQLRPPEAKLSELNYILNYLEFISSAIRYGDLDEELMRNSLRGMLCNLYETSAEFVQYSRYTGGMNPTIYEHLEWLYKRWYEKDKSKKHLVRN